MNFTAEQLERLKKRQYHPDGNENQVYSNDGYADSVIKIDQFGMISYDFVPINYPEKAEYAEFEDFDELAEMLDI